MAATCVIVDLDGTLLDTRARHHAVYAEAFQALGGEPLPLGPFWRAKRRGVGWERLIGSPAVAEAFLDRFRRRIEANEALALDTVHPGVRRALRRLAARGLGVALVTARRDREALRRQLDALGLRDHFSSVTATAAGPKAPPQAEVARAIRWIGDTEADIEAARAAAIPVTVVACGIRSAARLRQAAPDDLASTFGAAVSRL